MAAVPGPQLGDASLSRPALELLERASAGDRANEIVAQRIIELAKSGEHDPDPLPSLDLIRLRCSAEI
jgi:hypothetical protein